MQKNKKIKIIVISVICFIGIFFVSYLLFNLHNKYGGAKNQYQNPLASSKSEVPFPLYYPENLPAGVSFDSNSLSIQSGVVNFSYSYGSGKKLSVTEQARPPMMEQVQQIQTVNTPIGQAYIANLNGNISGFIVTNKTLIIISNATESDSSLLADLMSSMRQL